MSNRRWRHISTLKDDDSQGVRDILVWNSCNGPHYISYVSDEWFRIFHGQGDGWDMWLPVIRPTNDEIIAAAKVAKREAMRPVIQPSCGCVFCDLDLAPTLISGVAVHATKRGNVYCHKTQ
jgi:hypothetical protein